MQVIHMHDLSFKSVGTKFDSSKGIFTSLHQQGVSLLTMHELLSLQNGQVFSFGVYFICKPTIFYIGYSIIILLFSIE